MTSAFLNAAHLGAAILINSLWQGALIAGVTALALRLFPKANASTRYAAWSLALVALFITPIATSVTRISSTAAPVAVHATQTVRAATAEHAVPARNDFSPRREAAGRPSPTLPANPPAWHLSFAMPSTIASVVFALWALAAIVVVVRLLVALLQLERLKNDALPLGVEQRETMNAWQRVAKGDRDVRICVSDDVEVPVAIGLFDAMILLPQHLVSALDTNEIDQICLHELAHLLRGDDWSNGLQRLLCALMFYNPAAWFIGRQMDVEREVACDDFVLELTGAAKPYASCLTKMAEMTAWPHAPLPAPGVFVTRKNISIRIERLLRSGRAIGRSITPSTATAVVAGLVAVIAALRMVTPSIAFTLPTVPATPAPVARVTPHAKPTHVAAVVPARQITVTVPAQHIRIPAPAIPSKTISLPSEHIAVHVPAIHVPSVRIAQNDRGCDGCNFSHAHLDGRDFSGQSLTAADFAYAHLNGANFTGAQLNGVNFHDADLSNVSFRNASLIGCDMHGARLSGVDLTGAHLNGCNIDVSTLPPAQARNVLLGCTGCSYEHADLQGLDLRGIHLVGDNLRGANLAGADLRNATFDGVNFSKASLRGANLDGASFTGCTFDGVDLRGVDLSHVQLSGSDLSHAILR